jgi:hypothetical protein
MKITKIDFAWVLLLFTVKHRRPDEESFTLACSERESLQYEITKKSPELGDDSGKWIEKRLQELGGSIATNYDVSYMNIAQGDSLPAPQITASYNFIILGGTFHDVSCPNLNPEGRDWQRPLKAWLLQQRNTGQPLL